MRLAVISSWTYNNPILSLQVNRNAFMLGTTCPNSDLLTMDYTPTKVSGFWERLVVFRILYQYSEYLTYRTKLSYHG